ncbi:MAG: hypothetical protein IPJ47_16365 [Anaerolineales bacterium]|nr:hypothetical protein [Anaerolineales bacterium]
MSIAEEYKAMEQERLNAGGGKPLAMPLPQEPNPPDKYNDGFLLFGMFCWRLVEEQRTLVLPFGPWWDSSTMPTTPINLTATAAIQSAQTQVYATQTAQAPTLTPTATSIPHNYMGIYTASIAQEMLAKQNPRSACLT